MSFILRFNLFYLLHCCEQCATSIYIYIIFETNSLHLTICSVYRYVCVACLLACLLACWSGMLVYSIVWTTWTRKYWAGALQRLAVVVLQPHPVLHVYESIQVGIETTGCELLDVCFALLCIDACMYVSVSVSLSLCLFLTHSTCLFPTCCVRVVCVVQTWTRGIWRGCMRISLKLPCRRTSCSWSL